MTCVGILNNYDIRLLRSPSGKVANHGYCGEPAVSWDGHGHGGREERPIPSRNVASEHAYRVSAIDRIPRLVVRAGEVVNADGNKERRIA